MSLDQQLNPLGVNDKLLGIISLRYQLLFGDVLQRRKWRNCFFFNLFFSIISEFWVDLWKTTLKGSVFQRKLHVTLWVLCLDECSNPLAPLQCVLAFWLGVGPSVESPFVLYEPYKAIWKPVWDFVLL